MIDALKSFVVGFLKLLDEIEEGGSCFEGEGLPSSFLRSMRIFRLMLASVLVSSVLRVLVNLALR